MANLDSSSTDNVEVCEYFDFANDVMRKAQGGIAIVAGAKCVLQESEGFGPSEELSNVLIMLRILGDKLESINAMMDGSSFSYTTKQAS